MSNVSSLEKKLLFTPEILQDPYPTYARLHAEGPLHYLEVGGNGAAAWSIFSHAECSAIAKDPRLSAKRAHKLILPLPFERQSEFKDLAHLFSLWMIFMDAPEHTRLRKLMNKGFAPSAIEALRPQVETIVNRMLGPLKQGSEIELISEFANPLPVRIILELLGIPQEMNDMLVELSRAVAGFRGTPTPNLQQAATAQAALIRLNEFFRQTVAERRHNKGTDLISFLISIEEQGEVLTEDELFAQCTALLFAGHETTRNLIGNGMYTLLRNPEQTEELRGHPEIIRSAVEELLRYESPVQFTSRVLKEDMEICGQRVPKNWSILCMLGAANRDPKQFDDPDRLNLKRLKNEHLAFSAGPHFCIGNQLARMEGQVALLSLVQRFPKMRLAGGQPEWAPTFGFRGLKALRVTL